MTWIVDWSQPEQYDHNVTAFHDEHDAYRQACHDMMNEVVNWDLSDPEVEAVARRINDYVLVGDFKNALREFNDDQGETGSEFAQYWRVYELKELIGSRQPLTLTLPDPPDDEEEEEDEEEECPSTPWVAATPGATCRGPCKAYNNMAYADQRDGTYVCYQCKLMSQVFGGKIP